VLIPLAWVLGLTLDFGLPGIYLAWIAFTVVLAILLRLRAYRMAACEAALAAKVSALG
jgi:Na+-driven multidrug efflux pump